MSVSRHFTTGKPRVGLNGHLLSLDASYRSAGVSRYISGLLWHLPQVARDLSYLAFLGDHRARFPGWSAHVSRCATQRPWVRIFWEQVVQPWSSYHEKLDLLHAPVYVGPLVCPCPVVATVHDLTFYLYPELLPRFNRHYLQRMTRRTVDHAAGIIAVSENTRTDLERILGLPRQRITVIPNGVGEEMRPCEDVCSLAAWRHERGLPEKMILFLGTLEPRKNIAALLEAYALLRQQRSLPHQLVIAGGKGWYYQEIEATVQRLGLHSAVLFPGFVPQDELPRWYNAAELFVYPSLYEGFGFPPLEAMACGTPVVVSNASSLPEVVGEAGLLVDPGDVQAMASAMSRVLADRELWQNLRERGLARARSYSWSTTALKTAQFYRRILGIEADDGS